jgi:hypothetical protein
MSTVVGIISVETLKHFSLLVREDRLFRLMLQSAGDELTI